MNLLFHVRYVFILGSGAREKLRSDNATAIAEKAAQCTSKGDNEEGMGQVDERHRVQGEDVERRPIHEPDIDGCGRV